MLFINVANQSDVTATDLVMVLLLMLLPPLWLIIKLVKNCKKKQTEKE